MNEITIDKTTSNNKIILYPYLRKRKRLLWKFTSKKVIDNRTFWRAVKLLISNSSSTNEKICFVGKRGSSLKL